MKKRIFLIISAAVIIYGVFWCAVNYILIPRVVIPKINEFISSDAKIPMRVSVKTIFFHPIRGFLLNNLEISGPAELNKPHILRAGMVDLDIAFLPLLWKTLDVKRANMFEVDMNICRDGSGIWNFQPILDFIENPDNPIKLNFIVREFKLGNGSIKYSDSFEKANSLERRFTYVNLKLTNKGGSVYRLILSGGAPDWHKEYIQLRMDCDTNLKYAKGRVKFNTIYLKEYWNYHLDDLLKPWQLDARDASVQMDFSWVKDVLKLNGYYKINGSAFKYGDISIRGDVGVNQDIKYIKGKPLMESAKIDVSMDNVVLLDGAYTLFDKGSVRAMITERKILFEEVSGLIWNRPVSFSGSFLYSQPQELFLLGKIGSVNNTLYLKLLPGEKGVAEWQASGKNSYLKVNADITNLKNMEFLLETKGDIKFSDLSNLLGIEENKLGGEVKIIGNAKGEMDKPDSIDGVLLITAKDFFIYPLQPISFSCDITGKNGLFKGNIPKINTYKGELSGSVCMDYQRWGTELNAENIDMKEFGSIDPQMQGLKGKFNAKAACAARWDDIYTMKGGGYFNLVNCDLRQMPMFKNTEKGISSVVAGFIMPNFSRITGNFDIKDKFISTKNLLCRSSTITLQVIGGYNFSGEADFTIGATLLGGSILRTAREIILPITIGFDLLTNSIKVTIKGKAPDIKQTTEIQPMAWLSGLLQSTEKPNPAKYDLKKVWEARGVS